MPVSLVQYDHVIETLAPDRTDQPFDVRGLPGRAGRSPEFLQAQSRGPALEVPAVDSIAVSAQVFRRQRNGEGFPELLGGRSVLRS